MKNFYGKRYKKASNQKINPFQNPLPKGAEKRFHFSDFTITLNEEEEGVAPTDSRLRKDQRLMEETKWDEANTEKQVCILACSCVETMVNIFAQKLLYKSTKLSIKIHVATGLFETKN